MTRRHDPVVVEAGSMDEILHALVENWDDTPTLPAAPTAALPAADPQIVPETSIALVQDPEPDEARTPIVASLGLLTDLATGRKDAAQVAQAAGMSIPELQDQVAYTLAEIEPDEITRVIGLQAIQQQIKSGALYGSVLASLARDLVEGRLTPMHKLEMAKVLARIGRVEPKEEKNASVGGGFTLNINLGDGARPVVIEAQPVAEGA